MLVMTSVEAHPAASLVVDSTLSAICYDFELPDFCALDPRAIQKPPHKSSPKSSQVSIQEPRHPLKNFEKKRSSKTGRPGRLPHAAARQSCRGAGRRGPTPKWGRREP